MPDDTQDSFAQALRRHDPLGVFDSLEPWQRKELVCAMQKVCSEACDRLRERMAATGAAVHRAAAGE